MGGRDEGGRDGGHGPEAGSKHSGETGLRKRLGPANRRPSGRFQEEAPEKTSAGSQSQYSQVKQPVHTGTGTTARAQTSSSFLHPSQSGSVSQ